MTTMASVGKDGLTGAERKEAKRRKTTRRRILTTFVVAILTFIFFLWG